MANAAGGTLGVDDKSREVLGIPSDRLDVVERWLGELCQQLIVPPLEMQTLLLELPDAAGAPWPVIVVTVPRSLWVHRSPGGYYRRVGHAKREMTPEGLARLFQQRSQVRLIRFEEQPVPTAQMSDLHPLLVGQFVRPAEGLHLLVEDEGLQRPSVAGVLVCSDRPTRWRTATTRWPRRASGCTCLPTASS